MSGKSWAYEVILSPRAVKQLKTLDGKTQERIKKALRGLERIPPRGDVKKLKGLEGKFRLRVGDWRVIFYFDPPMRKMFVLEILPRRDAY
ncbi:MAG: type II toxin-antitoxin system RelE/ParE family toxin [Bacillota bacterium]|nr:type II toxin-antitoxin system RelE/ParE family toxin [Bacillota bacterium]